MELLDYSLDQIKTLSNYVSQELTGAEAGLDTAFAFLKNPLPKAQFVPFNQIFQIITLGGSNISQALVSVNEAKQVQILNYQTKSFGLIENLETLANILLEVIDPQYSQIVLNFAYPVKPFVTRNGLLDGILTHGTKEHEFNGLIDKPVGETLAKKLEEKFQKSFKIICANDVVCLTLASTNSIFKDENFISMVLGTGNNFGMFLDNGLIVNLESGNFSNFEQTPSGKFIDSTSNNPGFQKFEKEVSGKYLFMHFNYYADSLNLRNRLADSVELNQLAVQSTQEGVLAKQILERSAALVAGMVAGIHNYKNKPLECISEGSLFYKAYNYQDFVNEFLTILGKKPNDITFTKVEQSSLIGAARIGTYIN